MSMELQNIDCNCNNCVHMIRDIDKWKYWHDWHRAMELIEFDKAKAKAIAEALLIEDEDNKRGMLRVANKMKFQFEKAFLIGYGTCAKLNKLVNFLPNTCQLDTQLCFQNRRLTLTNPTTSNK